MSGADGLTAVSFFRANITADRIIWKLTPEIKDVRITIQLNKDDNLCSLKITRPLLKEFSLMDEEACFVVCFLKERLGNTKNLFASFPNRAFSDKYVECADKFKTLYNNKKHDA